MARQSVKGAERRLGLEEANHAHPFFSGRLVWDRYSGRPKAKKVESKPRMYYLDKVVDISSFGVLLELNVNGPNPNMARHSFCVHCSLLSCPILRFERESGAAPVACFWGDLSPLMINVDNVIVNLLLWISEEMIVLRQCTSCRGETSHISI